MGNELIGSLPPSRGRLLDCPQAYLFPNAGGWTDEMEPPTYYEDYQAVVDAHVDYQSIVDIHNDYRGLLSTERVAPAPGSGGYGWVGGVTDIEGVEVWLTKVDGWDEGLTVDVKADSLGMMEGTHVSAVLGRGRQVVVAGSLFDPSGGSKMPAAQAVLSSALGTAPHYGWLLIDDLWLPVALGSKVKQDRVDSHMVNFEFTLLGRGGVSPGNGVHRETRPGQSLTLVSGQAPVPVANDGLYGVAPEFEWRPSSPTDTCVVTLSGAGESQSMAISSAGLGTSYDPDIWLRVDTVRRRIDVMTAVDLGQRSVGSGYHLVDWDVSDWLEIPPTGCDVGVDITTGSSELVMNWVSLS